MIESKKELVVLETTLSTTATKRSPFHLLSSIFSKRKSNIFENDGQERSRKPNEFQSSSQSQQLLESECNSPPKESYRFSGKYDSCADKPDANFLSPIAAARRKNLKIDIETLHQSRQDNPYLKQLERFSLPEETILSCSDLNCLEDKDLLQNEWIIESEGDPDLHQHLVRSPPPQFPQNITHFVYSQVNSPKRQSSDTNDKNEDDSEKNTKTLNPLQAKKEAGVLDPSIREVLEYQKSQLLAGLQHSLNIGQAKFGTAPALYVPVQVARNQNAQNSQSRWAQESGSRAWNLEQQNAVPHATSSLPGLTSCCFELEQTCRRTTLGPIRIGRTLSDSIYHDSKTKKHGPH